MNTSYIPVAAVAALAAAGAVYHRGSFSTSTDTQDDWLETHIQDRIERIARSEGYADLSMQDRLDRSKEYADLFIEELATTSGRAPGGRTLRRMAKDLTVAPVLFKLSVVSRGVPYGPMGISVFGDLLATVYPTGKIEFSNQWFERYARGFPASVPKALKDARSRYYKKTRAMRRQQGNS
jgi:hypothetical protein